MFSTKLETFQVSFAQFNYVYAYCLMYNTRTLKQSDFVRNAARRADISAAADL